MQWACDIYVKPISPFWIGVLCVAVGFSFLSILAVCGAFGPLLDVVKRIVKGFRMRHLLLVPFAATLYVYGSTKPDVPPVVVQKGIKLTMCVQNSRQIRFEWIAEDDRIAEGAVYYVQEMVNGVWVTVAETTNTYYELIGFTIDRTRKYRITTDVTEGKE